MSGSGLNFISLIILFAFSVLEVPHCFCQTPLPVLHGAYIYDLYGDQSQNEIMAQKWVIYGLANSSMPKIGCTTSYRIFGGPGLLNIGGYFERLYTSLPVHETISIYIVVHFIDDWQSPDHLDIQIDDRAPIKLDPFPIKLTSPLQYCGISSKKDMYDSVFLNLYHNSSTLKLRLIPNITKTSDLASFGFRDVTISFRNHTNNFTEDGTATQSTLSFGTPKVCGAGSYKNSSSCSLCHQSCGHCFGPSDTDCYYCKFPQTFDGIRCRSHSISGCNFYSYIDNRCSLCYSTYTLLWNGTCVPNAFACNSPYIKETSGGYSVCRIACQTNNTYLMWNGSCVDSCNFPLIKKVNGYASYCDYPCNPQTNEYLYSNGSCLPSCIFFTRTFGGYKFCDHCPVGQFMYTNGTCIPGCENPRIQRYEGGYYYCDTPCPNASTSMDNKTITFWNRSCFDSCEPPLVKKVDGADTFCDYPCNLQVNEYLYSNGSCLSFCPFLSRIFGSQNFCDLCPSGQFMYPNNTCIGTCVYPRIQRYEGEYYFCDSPCPSSSIYYYRKDGKCRASCTYPNKIDDDTLFCTLDLSEPATRSLTTIATLINTAGYLANITTAVVRFISYNNPSAIFFGTLSELMKYIKYLKIKYPPKLQYILDQPELEGLFSSIFAIPEHIEDYFTKASLPEKFEKYDFHSSFIVNFWGSLVSLLIVASLIFLTMMLKFCFPKDGLINYCCTKLKQVIKWNVFLSFFIGYFGDIAFFTSFEFTTVQLNSFFSVLSFITCIFINITGVALLVRVFIIIKEIVTVKTKDQNNQSLKLKIAKEKWNEYEVMFEAFKDDSLTQKSFLLVFSIRLYIFNAVITYFYEYPLVQTILTTLISLFMLVYLTIKRPFLQKVEFIECLVQEVMLQTLNISVLILASFDVADREAFDAREGLGIFIIALNATFCTLSSLYLVVKACLKIKEIVFNAFKRSKLDKARLFIKKTRSENIDKKDQNKDLSKNSDQNSMENLVPQKNNDELSGLNDINITNLESSFSSPQIKLESSIKRRFQMIWRGNRIVNKLALENSKAHNSEPNPAEKSILEENISVSDISDIFNPYIMNKDTPIVS